MTGQGTAVIAQEAGFRGGTHEEAEGTGSLADRVVRAAGAGQAAQGRGAQAETRSFGDGRWNPAALFRRTGSEQTRCRAASSAVAFTVTRWNATSATVKSFSPTA